METWPSGFPDPLRDGEISPVNGLLDPNEDLNPLRTREYPENEMSFPFMLTAAQWATLRTFYDTTTNGGCIPFTADWLEDLGFSDHFLRFTGPPSGTPIRTGTYWRVVMDFEIIAGVPLSGGDPDL